MTIYNNFQLSNILWYKIGGKTKYLLEAYSKDDIYQAIDFIQKNKIKKMFICGLGSNLIFTDEYYDGAVIRISANENNAKPGSEWDPANNIRISDDNKLTAFAGTTLDTVIQFSLQNNLTGLEWAGGLPGTVGAAVRGNVGAFGGEIKDTLASAEILELEDGTVKLRNLSNQELNFVYRGSIVKEKKGKMIVVSARFNLQPSDEETVEKAKNIYVKNIQHRKDRHPLEYPNCGSVFKNIRDKEKIQTILQVFPDIQEKIDNQWYGKIASGYLIQRLGLQGLRIGDAEISMKHALFIVNLGQAKAKDVLTIIDIIQTKFTETFGFKLEPEVEIVTLYNTQIYTPD